MKIVQVNLERNFHVSNDDRFLLEKASLFAALDEGENEQDALNSLREMIATNFKNAYPKIEMNINFEYAKRDVPNWIEQQHEKMWSATTAPSSLLNGALTSTEAQYDPTIPHTYTEEKVTQEQRIIKQINECSDKVVLESFELLAKNKPEVKKVYDKRKKELS